MIGGSVQVIGGGRQVVCGGGQVRVAEVYRGVAVR